MLFGGIEAGGTKFVCAVGSGPGETRAEARIPTTEPEATLGQAVAFFQDQEAHHGKLAAIGIASFGPLDPRPESPTYGYITSTAKPGWVNTDVLGRIRSAFFVPVAFDTDVNGAALGEWMWGNAQGLDTFIYLTIGTGIGGGGMVGGQLMHGLIHPEMGHILLPHDRLVDPFEGSCPYHGDCFEGLASGPALEKRWGQPGETLPTDHPAWEIEAGYIAAGLANLVMTLSPQRVLLGGGVMEQPHLLAMVRTRVVELLNGYVRSPVIQQQTEAYIVPPSLGSHAGVLGAIALARVALETERR